MNSDFQTTIPIQRWAPVLILILSTSAPQEAKDSLSLVACLILLGLQPAIKDLKEKTLPEKFGYGLLYLFSVSASLYLSFKVFGFPTFIQNLIG